jgi:hypothetical protein
LSLAAGAFSGGFSLCIGTNCIGNGMPPDNYLTGAITRRVVHWKLMIEKDWSVVARLILPDGAGPMPKFCAGSHGDSDHFRVSSFEMRAMFLKSTQFLYVQPTF